MSDEFSDTPVEPVTDLEVPPVGTAAIAVRPRWFNPLVFALAMVVLIAVIATFAFSLGGSNNNASAAAIRSATASTLGDHSASVVITASVTAGGQQINLSGTGVLDFSHLLSDLTVSTTGSTSIVEHLVMSGTQMFMSFNGGGRSISSVVPGKSWVLYPLPAVTSPSLGNGIGNPITAIQTLSAKGNTITSLGDSTINGVAVTGYSIVPNVALISKQADKYFATMGLSGTALASAKATAKAIGDPTISVWIDSHNLLRRMALVVSSSVQGSTFSENMQADYSNFGVPVSVSIPPASQVVNFKDFLAAAEQMSGTTG